jgi:hypothetical protein
MYSFQAACHVEKIKMEAEMENMFFSYFVYLLNEPRFKENMNQIVSFATNPILLESNKVFEIEKILKNMIEVDFIEDFTEEDLITTRDCFIKDCKVVFPKINSIDGQDNEIKYYNKLASYIARYPIKQIQSTNSYLIFNPTKLTIYPDELYIMQQFLTKEYFEELIPAPKNASDYDNVEPIVSANYDSTIDLKKILNPTDVDFEEKKENMHSVRWRKCFPESKEVYYVPTKKGITPHENNKYLISGTYHFAIQVLKRKGDFTESNITQMLYEEYMNIQMLEYLKNYYGVETLEEIIDTRNKPPIKNEYSQGFKEYFEKIIDLLKIEGKNGLAKIQTQKKIHPQVVLNNMLNDNNYFLSVMDLWLLFKHVGISVVFISSFHIKIMNENNKNIFTGNMVDEDIVFIVVPGLGENKIPTFKYIENGVCEIGEPIIFSDFLNNHQIETKTEYKKQRKMVIIDEPEDPKPKPNRKIKIIDL